MEDSADAYSRATRDQAYHFVDDALLHELDEARPQDLVDGFSGRQVDVLYYIRAIHERRVWRGCQFRLTKRYSERLTDSFRQVTRRDDQDVLLVPKLVQLREQRIDHLQKVIYDFYACKNGPNSRAKHPRVLFPPLRRHEQPSRIRPHLHCVITRQKRIATILPIRTTTNVCSSSTSSITLLNNLWTSFPDSENQREKSECELISSSRV